MASERKSSFVSVFSGGGAHHKTHQLDRVVVTVIYFVEKAEEWNRFC